MKFMMKLWIVVFGVLMMSNVTYAESPPREQLKQMVEQLQKSPTDSALREKIIKLAQTIKPAPAVPEEAERFEGRAQFAFTNAKSSADYLDAAKEYEKAVAAAPWVAGYYSDLCTIYLKAEKYAEAKKSCEFFLASSPSAQDASDVRKRIAGLEFAIEKANSPEAQAAKRKQQEQEERRVAEEMIRGLEGAEFAKPGLGVFTQEHRLRIRGNRVEQVDRRAYDPRGSLCLCDKDNLCDGPIGEEMVCSRSNPFAGRIAETIKGDSVSSYEIADNGRVITVIYSWKSGGSACTGCAPDRYERQ